MFTFKRLRVVHVKTHLGCSCCYSVWHCSHTLDHLVMSLTLRAGLLSAWSCLSFLSKHFSMVSFCQAFKATGNYFTFLLHKHCHLLMHLTDCAVCSYASLLYFWQCFFHMEIQNKAHKCLRFVFFLGIANIHDNCKKVFNPDQNDRDYDRVGDVCDSCPDKSDPNQVTHQT